MIEVAVLGDQGKIAPHQFGIDSPGFSHRSKKQASDFRIFFQDKMFENSTAIQQLTWIGLFPGVLIVGVPDIFQPFFQPGFEPRGLIDLLKQLPIMFVELFSAHLLGDDIRVQLPFT